MTHEVRLSTRLALYRESSTVAVAQRIHALRRTGADVVNFAQGEPDLDTPAHIRAAANAAIDGGATRYTEVPGTARLREAVVAWLRVANSVELSNDNVMVSAGAKQVVFNLFQALLNEGDEVVIPTPCWTSYPTMVTAAGGVPILAVDCARRIAAMRSTS